MKNCDECNANPANIHLTQIVMGQVSVAHLCEECARKKGIAISIANENSVAPGAEKKVEEAPDVTCGSCGLKFSEFRSQGWLGCAQCYDAFEKEIDRLLVQVHGSSEHRGKRYAKRPTRKIETSKVKDLRYQLKIAIQEEEFELAAALRDMIKTEESPSA